MALSEKDILTILGWLEKSDWQELHLESGTFKLTVSKNGRPAEIIARSAPAEPASAARRAAEPAGRAPQAKPPAEPVDPTWVAVRSPTLGNFYAAPSPGAAPFVTVGQSVGEDDTVAIVEVMKLMNHVKAGVAGTVARISGRNGELVEFDEVILWIDPA